VSCTLDRICLAATERKPAVERWKALLGAEPVGEEAVPAWGARRTTLRVGHSDVEVFEPDGIGLLAMHLGRKGAGLLALGWSVADPDRTAERLGAAGGACARQGDQILVASDRGVDLPGVHCIFSPPADPKPAGPLDRLLGATGLVQDHRAAARQLAAVLELPAERIEAARHPHFADASVLRTSGTDADHVAFATPWYLRSNAGRLLQRTGMRFWLASARAADAQALRVAAARARPAAQSTPEGLVLPASELGGLSLHVATETPTGASRGPDPVLALWSALG